MGGAGRVPDDAGAGPRRDHHHRSMAAHGGWGGFPSYAISKHATLGLATNLANEWGRYGIR